MQEGSHHLVRSRLLAGALAKEVKAKKKGKKKKQRNSAYGSLPGEDSLLAAEGSLLALRKGRLRNLLNGLSLRNKTNHFLVSVPPGGASETKQVRQTRSAEERSYVDMT